MSSLKYQSQCHEILNFMATHGSITPMDALQHLGCMRLASRICDLKKRGVHIKKQMVEVPTRDGVTRVARYTLIPDDEWDEVAS